MCKNSTFSGGTLAQAAMLCFTGTDVAAAGPGKGMARSKLCQDLVNCVHSTGCNAGKDEDCWCGVGADGALCASSTPTTTFQPSGACKAQVMAAAESTTSGVIAANFYDGTLASGAAFFILDDCDKYSVPKRNSTGLCLSACSAAQAATGTAGGTGSGGSGGHGTAGSSGGTAGSSGGTAGSGDGTAGSSGGTAGSGDGTAGSGDGTAGSSGGAAGSGTAGDTGSAGDPGGAGTGATAGTTGSAGDPGGAGSGGTGGAGDSGTGGSSGSAGAAGDSGSGSAGQSGTSGTGGSGGGVGSGGSGGTGGSGGVGGAGGSDVPAPISIGGMQCTATSDTCPDLNGNGVPDCTETLVMNAAFNTDISSWTAEPGAALVWNSTSAEDQKAGSGALAVTSKSVSKTTPGWIMQGAFQCVPVDSGSMYDVGAQLSVAANPGGGAGLVGLLFYASGDCSGDTVGVATSDQVTATGMCEALSVTRTAPVGAASAAVRLVVIKPFPQAPLTVEFDNVLFKKH
jgi:hypothetical protein